MIDFDALAAIKKNNQTLVNIHDIYNLVENIDTNYVRTSSREFIVESLENFFLKTEFNGLYSYPTPDDKDNNYLKITCCKIPENKIHSYLDAFFLKFLSFPLFWKDYICMFYIALKQFSNIQSNSRIICLGESPMKIVLIQEFFFKNKIIHGAIQTGNYATDVSFEYFSMSRLQSGITYLYGEHLIAGYYNEIYILFKKGNVSALNTQIINLFIHIRVLAYFEGKDDTHNIRKLAKVKHHFTCWKLNPLYILEQNKRVYFEDICESYASVLGLIYHYIQLCNQENLTSNERKKLYSLLYIVGFDSKDETTEIFKADESKLYCINYLMYYLFCSPFLGIKNEDLPEKDKLIALEFSNSKFTKTDYHFIQVNYNNKTKYLPQVGQTSDAYFIEEIEKDIFFSQKDSLRKNIYFLTLPEFGQNNTRCIQGVNLYADSDSEKFTDMQCQTNSNVKQQGEPGLNCNLFNFFIIYYLNQLASANILSDMVLNLDSIDETEIFNNSTYNKDIFGGKRGEKRVGESYLQRHRRELKEKATEKKRGNDAPAPAPAFDADKEAKDWWAKVNTQKIIQYNAQLEIFRQKIIDNLALDTENKNYFNDLIKMIDIQRMIGSIKRNGQLTDIPYDILFTDVSTIPTTSNVNGFIYNEDYKKIFKPKEDDRRLMEATPQQAIDIKPATVEKIATSDMSMPDEDNSQKKNGGKKQTRKKKLKKFKKTNKRKNYFSKNWKI